MSAAPAQPLREHSASRENLPHEIRRLLLPLLGMEALFVALMAVAPLGGMQQMLSPLAWHWPWLLAPARWVFGDQRIWTNIPAESVWPALALYAALLVFASGFLALAVRQAFCIRSASRRHLALVLGGAALLGITLALLPALPSNDVFSYIFYGRIVSVYHANPLVVTPAQYPYDPFLPLVFWQGVRSVYGPIFLDISALLTSLAHALGGSLAVYVGLFKALGLIAHLANALLIWAILGVVAPSRRLYGTLLYAWNPLCLLEFSASAHNDVIMLTFALAGVYLLVRGLEAPALVAFALSIATKYVLLAVLPIYFALVIRRMLAQGTSWRGILAGLAWRAGLLVAVLAAVIAPYWSGPRIIGSIIYSPPAQHLDNSLLDAISWPLRSVAEVLGLSRPLAAWVVDTGLKAAGVVALVVILLRWCLRVRSGDDMLRGWTSVLFWYVVLAAGWFWPWYVTWPVAFAALLPFGPLPGAVLLLSAGALAEYAFFPLYAAPQYGMRAWIAFGPALLYLLWSARSLMTRRPGWLTRRRWSADAAHEPVNTSDVA